MHLIGDSALGFLILGLMGAMVAVKRVATGSVLDERPDARPLVRLGNAFNLTFLLVVNPAAAVLLVAGRLEAWDITHLAIPDDRILTAVEGLGILCYGAGAALMMWALLSLRSSYQLGGMSPRARDALVTTGPYAGVRHPMYTAALALALGLALAVQSLLCLAVFGAYVVLLAPLIPQEEEGLRRAYGEAYDNYAREVPRILPLRVRNTGKPLAG